MVSALKELWRVFGLLMLKFGRIQAYIMLFLTYYLLLPLLSISARLTVDPLRLNARHSLGSNWILHDHKQNSLSDIKRQF